MPMGLHAVIVNGPGNRPIYGDVLLTGSVDVPSVFESLVGSVTLPGIDPPKRFRSWSVPGHAFNRDPGP